MNKHLLTAATALLAVGLLVGPALAQEGERGQRGQKRGMREHRKGEGRREGAGRGERMQKYARARYRMKMSRLIRGLELSDKKADEVREVFKEHAEERKEANKETREDVRELRQEIKEARESDDQATVDQKMKEIREIFEAQREQGHKDLIEKLSDVLDKDQLAKAQRILKPRKGHRLGRIAVALRTMDLDEGQVEKIQGIMDDAQKKILETLTPQQKEQLEKAIEKTAGPKAGLRRRRDGDGPRRRRDDGEERGRRGRGRNRSSEDQD